uniref:DUF4124 domain-containing protein n=1 Tax=Dechloromonas aromatica (strain RCB) TaxID=159087 RepID=Q47F28_DECAR
MRYSVFFALLLCSNVSSADVFTCHTSSGETVYSDIPCAKGAVIEKISPSESDSDPATAKQELERQKAYTARQAAENARERAATGPAILPDYSSPPPASPAPTPLSPSSSGGGTTPPRVR